MYIYFTHLNLSWRRSTLYLGCTNEAVADQLCYGTDDLVYDCTIDALCSPDELIHRLSVQVACEQLVPPIPYLHNWCTTNTFSALLGGPPILSLHYCCTTDSVSALLLYHQYSFCTTGWTTKHVSALLVYHQYLFCTKDVLLIQFLHYWCTTHPFSTLLVEVIGTMLAWSSGL